MARESAAGAVIRTDGRPLSVTLAAVLLMVLGLLAMLFGALMMLLGGGVYDIDFGGMMAIVGALVLLHGRISFLAGIGAIRQWGWARTAGTIVAALGVLIWGVSLAGTVGSAASVQGDISRTTGGAAVAAVTGLAYIFILYALALRWRRPDRAPCWPAVQLAAALQRKRLRHVAS